MTPLLFGIVTLKQIGLFIFGSYVVFVVIFMWREYVQQREFIWATALYLGFFMLPTQIHERYLFPATVLALIAIVQDRRMWLIALPLMLSYTCNIVVLPLEHFVWLGLDLTSMLWDCGLAAVMLNLLSLLAIAWLVVQSKTTADAISTGSAHPGLEIT